MLTLMIMELEVGTLANDDADMLLGLISIADIKYRDLMDCEFFIAKMAIIVI